MNDSAKANKVETLDCPLRGHWVSFRLVDEHGDGRPYAGLPYTLHDSQGQKYEGTLTLTGLHKEGVSTAVLLFLIFKVSM